MRPVLPVLIEMIGVLLNPTELAVENKTVSAGKVRG
jgi:hypothetical protein